MVAPIRSNDVDRVRLLGRRGVVQLKELQVAFGDAQDVREGDGAGLQEALQEDRALANGHALGVLLGEHIVRQLLKQRLAIHALADRRQQVGDCVAELVSRFFFFKKKKKRSEQYIFKQHKPS